ncbi:hypothetical protein V5799_015186 [Amblyomma americanum]|uniref:JmjC domain-containing histone demethylation protein 2C n=1 Tax=Amblyomma americanum TaxID=6943 RepID=A0AAQ4E0V5_AMBAM
MLVPAFLAAASLRLKREIQKKEEIRTDGSFLSPPPLFLQSFNSYIDRVGVWEQALKPIEYLTDRFLKFVSYSELRFYKEHDVDVEACCLEHSDTRWLVKHWVEFQDSQRILVTTPSVLVGYRVKVYRAEGTTQWYTAVIVSYNDNTRELTVTDDTVLEEHNEDPCLVQMRLIGDGVVESILKGENVGITPRRRTCTLNSPLKVSHIASRTRHYVSQAASQSSCPPASASSSPRRVRVRAEPTPEPPEDCKGLGPFFHHRARRASAVRGWAAGSAPEP